MSRTGGMGVHSYPPFKVKKGATYVSLCPSCMRFPDQGPFLLSFAVSTPSECRRLGFRRMLKAVAILAGTLLASIIPMSAQGVSTLCEWTKAWTTAGAMAAPRYVFTATLLQNGKVLVVGGVGAKYTLGTAELYDPATGLFTPTGSLNTPRQGHVAALLPNGHVLIAGGFEYTAAQSGRLNSAEDYDPNAGTFTQIASPMSTDRQDAVATVLSNGSVLITGGFGTTQYGYSNALTSADIYNPSTGTFAATAGTMSVGRQLHTATLLQDGTVLIAGGLLAAGATTAAEVFDSNTETFTVVGSMTAARYKHTATLMPNGAVLITGGFNGPTSLATVELFNPASKTFSQYYASMQNVRGAHSAVLTPLGTVFLIGGVTSGSPLTTPTTVEEFSPSGITRAGSLANGRYYAAAVLLQDGHILVTGGIDATNTPLSSTELYDPLFSYAGTLKAARQDHTATLLQTGEVLIAGGSDGGDFVGFTSAELFEPWTNSFVSVGSMTNGRHGHRATLLTSGPQSGNVLMTGGQNGPTSRSIPSAELYNSAAKAFSSAGQMTTPRYLHTATLLADGQHVLITGGLGSSGESLNSAEIYDSTTNTFTATAGQMNFDRNGHVAALLPNGSVLVAGGWSTIDGGVTYTTEIFDPTTGRFTSQPQPNRLIVNLTRESLTVLPGGQFLLAGGIAQRFVSNSAQVYNPTANSFQLLTSTMSGPRFLHGAALMAGAKVMVAGGSDQDTGTGDLTSVDVFDPASSKFSPTGPLNLPRKNLTATLLNDGRVLIVGGAGTYSGPVAFAEVSKTTICGPNISLLSPALGSAGTAVTIHGTGFGVPQGSSTVTFNGTAAGTATVWADQQIQIPAPTGVRTGPVVVTVNGVPSNEVTFRAGGGTVAFLTFAGLLALWGVRRAWRRSAVSK